MGVGSVLRVKISGDGHSNVNVLNTTELST